MSNSPIVDYQDITLDKNQMNCKKPLLYPIKIILCTPLLIVWCLFMLLVLFIWRLCRAPKVEKLYFVFHGGCCRLFNLRCHVKGKISTVRPTLFLSNHVSYLDVFVLGQYVPAFFIAKSEVSGWPILGWLAKAQNTLFFERNGKRVKKQMAVMSEHFDRQGNLILFPEGTSTNGEYIQPFKSSLLQSVELAKSDVLIQTVTLAYTHYQGVPMNSLIRDQYAWYAKMPFASHFFNALGLAQARVELIFHPPVSLNDFTSRKECAQYCQEQVSSSLLAALSNTNTP
jgi:lyso-ornithine lipid O-acyltransferase